MAENTFTRNPLLWLVILAIVVLLVILIVFILTREEDDESCTTPEVVMVLIGLAAVIAAFAIGWYLGKQCHLHGTLEKKSRTRGMTPLSSKEM